MTKLEENLIALAEQALLETTSIKAENYEKPNGIDLICAKEMNMDAEEHRKFSIAINYPKCRAMCDIAKITDSGLSNEAIRSLNDIENRLLKFVRENND